MADGRRFGLGREIFPREERGVNQSGELTTGRVRAKRTDDGISRELGFKELGFPGMSPQAEPEVTDRGWRRRRNLHGRGVTSVSVSVSNSIFSTSHVGTPSLGQTHKLTPAGIFSTSHVGTPEYSPLPAHNLTPISIAAASSVGQPIFNQTRKLTAASISSTSHVAMPFMGSGHALTPAGVNSTSHVGQSVLGQRHSLTPVDVAANSTVGTPSLGVVESIIYDNTIYDQEIYE